MTQQWALTVGCGLLAFGPTLALFFVTVYHKAQLVILVTTAAFFYLVSATASAFVWWCVDAIFGGSSGGSSDSAGTAITAILPSVLFQFLLRAAFCALYHKVELVIATSLMKEQQQQQQQQDSNHNNHDTNYSEAARLRLELNDSASAIAAATGFGGMHVLLLYGTLLASEITNNVGVLYQDSCPWAPSLAVSALVACLFSILQVFWMLLTFFGMRRRLLYGRGESSSMSSPTSATVSTTTGACLGNSRTGGNLALLLVLVSHLAAAMFSTVTYWDNGCLVSVPLVGGTVLVTAYLFWAGCSRIYLPPPVPVTSPRPGRIAMSDHHRD